MFTVQCARLGFVNPNKCRINSLFCNRVKPWGLSANRVKYDCVMLWACLLLGLEFKGRFTIRCNA